MNVRYDNSDSNTILCCCSDTQACPTPCNSMESSMPGLPASHHHLSLPIYIHCIGDTIQSSLPLTPFLLLPSIFSSIRDCSNESTLHIRRPKYWSFSLSIIPSNQSIQDWFPLGLTDLIFLNSKELLRVFSNTTVQKHQFLSAQLSLYSISHIHPWLLEKP